MERTQADSIGFDDPVPFPLRVLQFLRPTLIAIGCFTGAMGIFWAIDPETQQLGLRSNERSGEMVGFNSTGVTLPSPKLEPDEVVRIQLAGLANRDDPDKGVLQCYCMASPSNRLVTGPLEKFTTIVRHETYAPLTAPQLTMVGTPDIKESEAHVMVSVVDDQDHIHAYMFVLERQAQSPYVDCWMTEGVFKALPPSSALADPSNQVKGT